MVGWSGSPTHKEDTAEVFPVVWSLLAKERNLVFEITGPEDTRLKAHDRLRYRNYVAIERYALALSSWSWDLFLAPLQYNKFNRSKSSIKILEAAAIGSPILVSNVGPYRDFCNFDKELDYLVCEFQSDWRDKIIELKHNPEQRAFLVERMRKVVREHFDISRTAKEWKELVENV